MRWRYAVGLANSFSTRGRLVKDRTTKQPKLNCRKYVRRLFGNSWNTNTDGFVVGSAAFSFPGLPPHQRG